MYSLWVNITFRCQLWWMSSVFLLHVLRHTNRNVFSHQSLKKPKLQKPHGSSLLMRLTAKKKKKKLSETWVFQKVGRVPATSPVPPCIMMRRGKKKKMNWVLPMKTLISPNCVAVWLSACLLIYDPSANWITFKAHQVQFALTARSDNSVHPAVLIIQAHASNRMYCLPPLYDSCGLNLGTFFKSQIQIRPKNGDYCSITTLK